MRRKRRTTKLTQSRAEQERKSAQGGSERSAEGCEVGTRATDVFLNDPGPKNSDHERG